MVENNLMETAFLSSLNDVQSLKKIEYTQYFHGRQYFDALFDNIFKEKNDHITAYPDFLKPLIEKSENVREKKLIDFYIDIIQDYQHSNVQILPYFDAAYPEKLLKITDPPLMLYLKGKRDCIEKPTIAIVGTRGISDWGIQQTKEAAKLCVQQSFVVVSGLALGTDTIAHKSVIECGGETIAVLPSDLYHIVPTENHNLADQIEVSGLLISEITPLVKMHKGRYIERNRITSALSDCVIIIETGETGGSIRQAETALKHGKHVYTLKPEQTNERAIAGHKKLISMGAIAIRNLDEFSNIIQGIHSKKSKIRTLSDFT